MNRSEAASLSSFIEGHDHRFRSTSTYPLFQALGQMSSFIVEADGDADQHQLYENIPTYVHDALGHDPDLPFILDLKQWLLTIKQNGLMP